MESVRESGIDRAGQSADNRRLTAAGTRRVDERHTQGIAVLLDSAQADPVAAEMLQLSVRRYRDALGTLAWRPEDLGALEPSDRGKTRLMIRCAVERLSA